jgi:SAM-dependent methyltransferase
MTANHQSNHQKSAYNSAYNSSDAIPFPDHKVEGDRDLRGKTIVSIGGGTGSDVAHLAKENRVYIVDYSTSAASAASAFGLIPIQADLNRPDVSLPFSNDSIDVLVLKDVLEHLMEPELVLQKLLPLVKSDGYIVISLPNHLNLWGRIKILFGGNLIWKGILHDHSSDYDEWNYMHIRFFTWSGVHRLLNKNHLKVTRTFFDFGPFGHYFSIPMYAEHLRMKQARGLLTTKGKWFLRLGYPIYSALNSIFPSIFRNVICRLNPSLLTSCFYFHVRKS